jgi:integrase/recombinase XerD
VKSLQSYAHRLGYAPFNVGAAIRVRSDARNRGATLAKRIISEVDVALLVRGARTRRDRVLLEVLYAGGLRVSELAGLTWSDIVARDTLACKGQVQLSVLGKGGIVRRVLLPEAVSRALLSLRGDSGANDGVFASRKTDARLTERAVLGIVKRAAARAGIEAPVSPHWLRHAHASHAIDRGATLPEVQSTLGHGNIATTSGYLHARPGSSSGLRLDEGMFLR